MFKTLLISIILVIFTIAPKFRQLINFLVSFYWTIPYLKSRERGDDKSKSNNETFAKRQPHILSLLNQVIIRMEETAVSICMYTPSDQRNIDSCRKHFECHTNRQKRWTCPQIGQWNTLDVTSYIEQKQSIYFRLHCLMSHSLLILMFSETKIISKIFVSYNTRISWWDSRSKPISKSGGCMRNISRQIFFIPQF